VAKYNDYNSQNKLKLVLMTGLVKLTKDNENSQSGKKKILIKEIRLLFTTEISTKVIAKSSVGDPVPDVFGPPGSGSISQRYGSGSYPFLIQVLNGLK
jgi:hypothetical protein